MSQPPHERAIPLDILFEVPGSDSDSEDDGYKSNGSGSSISSELERAETEEQTVVDEELLSEYLSEQDHDNELLSEFDDVEREERREAEAEERREEDVTERERGQLRETETENIRVSINEMITTLEIAEMVARDRDNQVLPHNMAEDGTDTPPVMPNAASSAADDRGSGSGGEMRRGRRGGMIYMPDTLPVQTPTTLRELSRYVPVDQDIINSERKSIIIQRVQTLLDKVSYLRRSGPQLKIFESTTLGDPAGGLEKLLNQILTDSTTPPIDIERRLDWLTSCIADMIEDVTSTPLGSGTTGPDSVPARGRSFTQALIEAGLGTPLDLSLPSSAPPPIDHNQLHAEAESILSSLRAMSTQSSSNIPVIEITEADATKKSNLPALSEAEISARATATALYNGTPWKVSPFWNQGLRCIPRGVDLGMSPGQNYHRHSELTGHFSGFGLQDSSARICGPEGKGTCMNAVTVTTGNSDISVMYRMHAVSEETSLIQLRNCLDTSGNKLWNHSSLTFGDKDVFDIEMKDRQIIRNAMKFISDDSAGHALSLLSGYLNAFMTVEGTAPVEADMHVANEKMKILADLNGQIAAAGSPAELLDRLHNTRKETSSHATVLAAVFDSAELLRKRNDLWNLIRSKVYSILHWYEHLNSTLSRIRHLIDADSIEPVQPFPSGFLHTNMLEARSLLQLVEAMKTRVGRTDGIAFNKPMPVTTSFSNTVVTTPITPPTNDAWTPFKMSSILYSCSEHLRYLTADLYAAHTQETAFLASTQGWIVKELEQKERMLTRINDRASKYKLELQRDLGAIRTIININDFYQLAAVLDTAIDSEPEDQVLNIGKDMQEKLKQYLGAQCKLHYSRFMYQILKKMADIIDSRLLASTPEEPPILDSDTEPEKKKTKKPKKLTKKTPLSSDSSSPSSFIEVSKTLPSGRVVTFTRKRKPTETTPDASPQKSKKSSTDEKSSVPEAYMAGVKELQPKDKNIGVKRKHTTATTPMLIDVEGRELGGTDLFMPDFTDIKQRDSLLRKCAFDILANEQGVVDYELGHLFGTIAVFNTKKALDYQRNNIAYYKQTVDNAMQEISELDIGAKHSLTLMRHLRDKIGDKCFAVLCYQWSLECYAPIPDGLYLDIEGKSYMTNGGKDLRDSKVFFPVPYDKLALTCGKLGLLQRSCEPLQNDINFLYDGSVFCGTETAYLSHQGDRFADSTDIVTYYNNDRIPSISVEIGARYFSSVCKFLFCCIRFGLLVKSLKGTNGRYQLRVHTPAREMVHLTPSLFALFTDVDSVEVCDISLDNKKTVLPQSIAEEIEELANYMFGGQSHHRAFIAVYGFNHILPASLSRDLPSEWKADIWSKFDSCRDTKGKLTNFTVGDLIALRTLTCAYETYLGNINNVNKLHVPRHYPLNWGWISDNEADYTVDLWRLTLSECKELIHTLVDSSSCLHNITEICVWLEPVDVKTFGHPDLSSSKRFTSISMCEPGKGERCYHLRFKRTGKLQSLKKEGGYTWRTDVEETDFIANEKVTVDYRTPFGPIAKGKQARLFSLFRVKDLASLLMELMWTKENGGCKQLSTAALFDHLSLLDAETCTVLPNQTQTANFGENIQNAIRVKLGYGLFSKTEPSLELLLQAFLPNGPNTSYDRVPTVHAQLLQDATLMAIYWTGDNTPKYHCSFMIDPITLIILKCKSSQGSDIICGPHARARTVKPPTSEEPLITVPRTPSSSPTTTEEKSISKGVKRLASSASDEISILYAQAPELSKRSAVKRTNDSSATLQQDNHPASRLFCHNRASNLWDLGIFIAFFAQLWNSRPADADEPDPIVRSKITDTHHCHDIKWHNMEHPTFRRSVLNGTVWTKSYVTAKLSLRALIHDMILDVTPSGIAKLLQDKPLQACVPIPHTWNAGIWRTLTYLLTLDPKNRVQLSNTFKHIILHNNVDQHWITFQLKRRCLYVDGLGLTSSNDKWSKFARNMPWTSGLLVPSDDVGAIKIHVTSRVNVKTGEQLGFDAENTLASVLRNSNQMLDEVALHFGEEEVHSTLAWSYLCPVQHVSWSMANQDGKTLPKDDHEQYQVESGEGKAPSLYAWRKLWNYMIELRVIDRVGDTDYCVPSNFCHDTKAKSIKGMYRLLGALAAMDAAINIFGASSESTFRRRLQQDLQRTRFHPCFWNYLLGHNSYTSRSWVEQNPKWEPPTLYNNLHAFGFVDEKSAQEKLAILLDVDGHENAMRNMLCMEDEKDIQRIMKMELPQRLIKMEGMLVHATLLPDALDCTVYESWHAVRNGYTEIARQASFGEGKNKTSLLEAIEIMTGTAIKYIPSTVPTHYGDQFFNTICHAMCNPYTERMDTEDFIKILSKINIVHEFASGNGQRSHEGCLRQSNKKVITSTSPYGVKRTVKPMYNCMTLGTSCNTGGGNCDTKQWKHTHCIGSLLRNYLESINDSPAKLKRFIYMCTGSDRIPEKGIACMIKRVGEKGAYPELHSCSNEIHMPLFVVDFCNLNDSQLQAMFTERIEQSLADERFLTM